MSRHHSLPSLDAVLDSVPCSAVAIIDRDGVCLKIAGPLWSDLDVDPERELMGRSVRELWDPETAAALHANIDRSLRGEISEGLVPWKDRIHRVTTAPIEATPETEAMVLLLARDVTDLRRQAEEDERQRRLRSLGRLAGGVAHDFGNLLTAIVGRVELIGERLSGSDLESEIDELRSALRTAERLTARLLSLGDRRDVGASSVPSEVFERLETLVRRVTPTNVSFRMNLGSQASVGLGPVDLEQILLNLATNAADAMPDGGVVGLAVVEEGDEVVVRVSDQGSGIDPDDLPFIFDSFYSTKRVGEGMGIGLSTVHALVDAVGGKVNVESTGTEGTTIALRLPRFESPVGTDPDPDPVPADGPVPLPSIAILVVEDEELILGFIHRALEPEGLEVVGVTDAASAREVLAERQDIAMVLSDVSLPGEDGISLGSWIVEAQPGVPVVLMSGNLAMQIERHGPPPTGVRTLEKPFGLMDLRRTIREAVSGA